VDIQSHEPDGVMIWSLWRTPRLTNRVTLVKYLSNYRNRTFGVEIYYLFINYIFVKLKSYQMLKLSIHHTISMVNRQDKNIDNATTDTWIQLFCFVFFKLRILYVSKTWIINIYFQNF